MTVGIFNALKRASLSNSEGKWAKVAYETYLGALIEHMLDQDQICLPKAFNSQPVNDVFRRLVVDIELAVRNSRSEELVASVVKSAMLKSYPC